MSENDQPGGAIPAAADAVASTPSAETAAQPAETEAETGAAEPTEETPPDAGAEAEQRKPAKGFQKRIDELTARQRDAERDRDYWREMAMRGGPQPAEKPAEATPQPLPPDLADEIGPPPTPWDYQKYPLGEQDPGYIADQRLHAFKAEQAQKVAKARAIQVERANAAYVTTVAEKITAAAERLPGLSVAAVSGLADVMPAPHCNIVAEAITRSAEGADLAHYLLRNPAEAQRIGSLTPVEAAFELGEVRARIKDARKAASATNAPEPPKTVAASRAQATRSVYDADLSFADYERMRKQGKA